MTGFVGRQTCWTSRTAKAHRIFVSDETILTETVGWLVMLFLLLCVVGDSGLPDAISVAGSSDRVPRLITY